MEDVYTADFNELLTPGIKDYPSVKFASKAIEPQLRDLFSQLENLKIRGNLSNVSDQVLDYLALEYRVFGYDSTLPRATRETMIRNSIQWLMRLGTPSVIDEVVSLVFSHAKCVEWFDYEPVPGTPYHFKVIIDDAQFDNEQVKRLISLVMELKNVRSFFDGIERLTTINRPVYAGLAVGRSRNQVTWIQ